MKISKSEKETGNRHSLFETTLLDALQAKELSITPDELERRTLVEVLREKLRSR